MYRDNVSLVISSGQISKKLKMERKFYFFEENDDDKTAVYVHWKELPNLFPMGLVWSQKHDACPEVQLFVALKAGC